MSDRLRWMARAWKYRLKIDPAEIKFIRRYLPELDRVPDRHLHFPAAMKPLELQACGLRLGQDYPWPVVDHASARERTLMRFHFLARKED